MSKNKNHQKIQFAEGISLACFIMRASNVSNSLGAVAEHI